MLQVWTHRNAATVVQPVPSVASRGPMVFSRAPLASDEIFYAGQIVALVVAETLEAARDAALRLQVAYDDAPVTATFDSAGSETVPAQAQVFKPKTGSSSKTSAKSHSSKKKSTARKSSARKKKSSAARKGRPSDLTPDDAPKVDPDYVKIIDDDDE